VPYGSEIMYLAKVKDIGTCYNCGGRLTDLGYTDSMGDRVFRCVGCGTKMGSKKAKHIRVPPPEHV